MPITLDYSKCVSSSEINSYAEKVKTINTVIKEKSGLGNDFLGWVDYPNEFDRSEVEQIKKDAEFVRNNFEVLVVCGIGGSYLGSRAAIEALGGLFPKRDIEIIFIGNTFSSTYVKQVLDYLKNKKFAINVISKSGTTTETSIAFRLLKELLEKSVGKSKAREAIFATTDKEKGALKTLSTIEGYQTYVLPSDIGGRFSVFTAVGLFPIAVAGYDISLLLEGAKQCYKDSSDDDLKKNVCYQYAVIRDIMLNKKNKPVELYVQYEPQFVQLSEWLKQLFGESEGKQKKGLLPDSVCFSTDLHSLGQFVQDGTPLLFETIIRVKESAEDVIIPHDKDDLDGLNYLENKKLSYVNEKAFEGTLSAHHEDGGVPCLVLNIEKMDEFNLGYFFYFFMRACAMSAYLLEVNPFNQPGVEIYKRNMFHLLGKKGY